ncbi:MAG: hypothetical protein GEU87_13700 [Alphaproteobacteria bacterium]|nr:hypothetical protein [Alphaproteobacteria bacterium]
MSGGEPLWRRVAGLYLSGVPLGDGEPMSTRLGAPAGGGADAGTGAKQEVVLLGEALDLVTLAQGYGSPAVPLLLRALIRGVREMGAASGIPAGNSTGNSTGNSPGNSHAADLPGGAAAESSPAPAEKDDPTDKAAGPARAGVEAPIAAATAAVGEGVAEERPESRVEPERPEPSERPERPGPDDVMEKRFQDADRKVSALTTAVGQLVEVLGRRARDGGGVDRRGFPRVPGGNAKLFVHGNAFQVVNWSRSGFLIRIAEADRFSRGGFDFHFVLELPDETIQFQGRALPVRIERTLLAAEFAALDEATGKKMAEIAARLASAPV